MQACKEAAAFAFIAERRRPMKKIGKHVGKSAIAVSAFACAALFSFGSSEHGGLSLSVESAQARVGRPRTPVSVAGVARRQTRRAAYGAGVAGAAAVVTAAAIGTAAAVGARCGGGTGGAVAHDPHFYLNRWFVPTASASAFFC